MTLLRNGLFHIFLIFLTFSAPASAEGCPARAAVSLFHSCEYLAKMSLRFHPLDVAPQQGDLLAVTGTYSSGDRFGVEGLAIGENQIFSNRYQTWDGLLVISPQGIPTIFKAENVKVGDQQFNIKTPQDRSQFVDWIAANGWAIVQSHLLIADGNLDLENVDGARKFIRRMVFMDEGGWGIYETKEPMTLYAAAVQIQNDLNPSMVLNLDMGAYNYCTIGDGDQAKSCGDLFVDPAKLTNIIVLSEPDNP